MRIRKLDDIPLVVTVKEVAQILGIGKNSAYNLVRIKAIKSVRVGRQIRISRAEIARYLGLELKQ